MEKSSLPMISGIFFQHKRDRKPKNSANTFVFNVKVSKKNYIPQSGQKI